MLFLVKAVLVKGSFKSASGAPLRRSELLPSDLSYGTDSYAADVVAAVVDGLM